MNKYFGLNCYLLEFVENLVFGRILDETKQTSRHYFHTFQVFTFNGVFILERKNPPGTNLSKGL